MEARTGDLSFDGEIRMDDAEERGRARARAERPQFALATADGARLVLDYLPAYGEAAPGPALGAVWLGHAVLANGRSLDRPLGAGLASEIAAAGLHTYVLNVRGHGGSTLPEAARGGWAYEDLVRFDFPAVTRFLRDRHEGLRVGALGHSLCGHSAAAWLGLSARAGERPPLDALVTLAANIWIPALEPDRRRWAKKLAVIAALRAIGAVAGKLPARALGIGSEDAPPRFAEQGMRWALSGRWASDEGEDYLASLAEVTAPVLAVLGAGDSLLCHPVCGELFHRRLARAPVEIHVASARELGFDPGHMALATDPRCRPIWRRIAAFFAATLGGERSAS